MHKRSHVNHFHARRKPVGATRIETSTRRSRRKKHKSGAKTLTARLHDMPADICDERNLRLKLSAQLAFHCLNLGFDPLERGVLSSIFAKSVKAQRAHAFTLLAK